MAVLTPNQGLLAPTLQCSIVINTLKAQTCAISCLSQSHFQNCCPRWFHIVGESNYLEFETPLGIKVKSSVEVGLIL